MKAGIITHYEVHNHGAQLQMYALSQVLKEFDYDAKALRFRKNYDFMGGAQIESKYNISLRSVPYYLGYMVKKGLKRTLYNYKKRKVLATFRRDHDLMGDYYCEAKDIDAVVIGSDEIFSIESGPNPWYYGIGIPCDKQISYAASFGPTTLELIYERNVDALLAAGIGKLQSISVRDKNSFDIVKHLTQKDATIVCDPVLLYGFQEEQRSDALEAFRKKHKKKYCIVYSYDNNMNDAPTVKAIRDYARKRGLKIYSVAYFHKWCDKNIQASPLDVFLWFANAEMVFTDTFHGSVLSLTTGAQFISQIRGNANKLAFLLEQYGVEQRKVNDFSCIEDVAAIPIDYTVVDQTILKIRQDSREYLQKALGELYAEDKN